MHQEASEQTPLARPKTPISQPPRADPGTVETQKPPSDPGLASIQDRWPKLPEHIKAAVPALVRTNSQG
jgi:hypothetical protein